MWTDEELQAWERAYDRWVMTYEADRKEGRAGLLRAGV